MGLIWESVTCIVRVMVCFGVWLGLAFRWDIFNLVLVAWVLDCTLNRWELISKAFALHGEIKHFYFWYTLHEQCLWVSLSFVLVCGSALNHVIWQLLITKEYWQQMKINHRRQLTTYYDNWQQIGHRLRSAISFGLINSLVWQSSNFFQAM